MHCPQRLWTVSARRVRVIAAPVEGNSIRSAVRMTSVAKNIVAKLPAYLGIKCAECQGNRVRGIKASRVS